MAVNLEQELKQCRKKYLSLTVQYSNDIGTLHTALKDLYDLHAGMEKTCGHSYSCVCPSDKAKELIELFEDSE